MAMLDLSSLGIFMDLLSMFEDKERSWLEVGRDGASAMPKLRKEASKVESLGKEIRRELSKNEQRWELE